MILNPCQIRFRAGDFPPQEIPPRPARFFARTEVQRGSSQNRLRTRTRHRWFECALEIFRPAIAPPRKRPARERRAWTRGRIGQLHRDNARRAWARSVAALARATTNLGRAKKIPVERLTGRS